MDAAQRQRQLVALILFPLALVLVLRLLPALAAVEEVVDALREDVA
jgi:hypothetical protein